MKYLVRLVFSLLLMSCSSEQKSNIEGLIIDPNIKNEVEKYITEAPELASLNQDMQAYHNSFHIESYKNDSLDVSSTDFSKKAPFKSFYYWHDGSLRIDGAYGIFGGFGFNIQISDQKATLYHMLSSDDFATYAYQENDDFILRLDVPCTATKIVLSEIPDSSKQQLIYGYVEFKSNDFYSMSDSSTGERNKIRNNMKIYFKSGFVNL
ncbi:hypothetical protein [uncultured Kordia sp.]|uniref:hypothetical protein n=1 Tax=uncultured Kordia sp. TaxID=507699 RepID=UPI002604B7DC|nr:hypothetical protein [uncultured Kordia sp.]